MSTSWGLFVEMPTCYTIIIIILWRIILESEHYHYTWSLGCSSDFMSRNYSCSYCSTCVSFKNKMNQSIRFLERTATDLSVSDKNSIGILFLFFQYATKIFMIPFPFFLVQNKWCTSTRRCGTVSHLTECDFYHQSGNMVHLTLAKNMLVSY